MQVMLQSHIIPQSMIQTGGCSLGSTGQVQMVLVEDLLWSLAILSLNIFLSGITNKKIIFSPFLALHVNQNMS